MKEREVRAHPFRQKLRVQEALKRGQVVKGNCDRGGQQARDSSDCK